MARIGRGVPPQAFSVAGQILGPREPAVVNYAPLVTTLSINLATGVLTNQRRAQQRRSTVQLRWQPQRRVFAATGTGNDSPSGGVLISTSGTQYAQQFTVARAVRLADVQLVLGLNFNPTDSVTFELHADSGGTPDVPVLASATIRARDFSSGSGGLFSIPLGASLAAGSYWVVLSRTGATDASNNVVWYDIGGPSLNPATTARNTGAGWVTGAFIRALTLLTQLIYDDVSGQLPMIGVKPPTQINAPAPVVTATQVNQAQGWLVNQRRVQQRRTTSFFVETPPVRIPPVVTTIDVTLAGRTRTELSRRFPLPGWDGDSTGTGTASIAFDNSVSSVAPGSLGFGKTGLTEIAISLTLSEPATSVWVEARINKQGSPTDNVVCELQTNLASTPPSPSGVVLASDSTPGSALNAGTPGTLVRFDLSGVALQAGTNYWFVIKRDGAADDVNFYGWDNAAGRTGASFHQGPWIRSNGSGQRASIAVAYGRLTLLKRNLGPRPPAVFAPKTSLGQQTITDALTAVSSSRVYLKRRFPLQGWTQASCFWGGAQPTGDSVIALAGPQTTSTQLGDTSLDFRLAQQITSLDGVVTSVTLNMFGVGSPADNVYVTLQPTTVGNQIPIDTILATSDVVAGNTIGTTVGTTVTFTFSTPPPELSGPFWVVLNRSGGADAVNFYRLSLRSPGTGEGRRGVSTGPGVWSSFATSYVVMSVAFTPFQVQQLLQSRFLGPRPPRVMDLVPAQQQQTVEVVSQSVQERAQLQRRQAKSLLFPPATLANPPPTLYGLFVYPTKARRAAPAFSRLFPPTVVAAAFIPSPIDVSLAAVKTRNTNTERFPLPGWEGWGAVDRLSGFAYSTPNGSPLIFGDSFGDGGAIAGYGIDFTNIGGAFDFVDVAVRRTGTPTDNLVVEIRTDSAGVPSNTVLASATVAGSTLPTASQFTRLALASITVNRSQTYWIVLRRDGANDGSNYYVLFEGATSTGGRGAFFDGASASWVAGGFFWAHGIGIEATAGSKSFYSYKRNLGPWPPLLQNPLPTQQQQTVSVRSARVRRATPVFSRLAAPTVVTTAAFTPRPISVSLATIRNIAARRFPLQGWEQDVAEPSTWVQEITVANPTVWYRLGEAQGATTAVDQQGARNGTYPASAVLGQPSCLAGDSNTAVRLIGGGNTNAIQIAGTTPIMAGQTNSSVEMWVRSIDTGSRFFWTEKGSGNDSFEFTCAGGSLTFRYVEDNGTIDSNSTFGGGSPQFANGAATHIAFTRAGNSLRAYVNGVLVGTLTPTLGPQTDATFTVYLGGKSAAAGTLTGTIDEAAVYQRTLSADEIFQHYQAGVRVSGSAIVYQRRFLGPRPPTVIATIVAQATTIDVAYTVAVARRQTLRTRQAKSQLFPPATLAQPPPALYGLFIYPTKVRRVKPVQSRLAPPTIIDAAFTARPARVALVRATPRPTTKQLRRPTVVRIPSVEQREQTTQASLARTRPRHTFTSLPETIVTAAAFTAEPITVALFRVRPRRTTSFLALPVTLSTFSGPLVATVKTRPRLTITKLNEPTAVRVPSVEQQEDTVKVSLTRTRPRPTVKTLAGPTTLREFVGPQVTTVRTKPRPTVTRLGEPTVVRVPSVEQQEQTIRVALVQTRPRPTSKRLNPPRVVRVPSVEQVEQTVRVALTHTRPRPTVTRLEAPAVVRRPAVGNIATTLVGVKTRRDMSHQFSLQSARQRIVRETGSTVTYQQRDPFIGPRPPQIIDPLPTQRVQTIGVYEPRIKPRPTRTKLSAPTRINPLPTLRMQTVQVALVRTRPRKTVQVLAEPTTVTAGFFAEPITVTQTRARPRPTIKALYEPTVVRVPSVEQQEDTIKVSLVRARPRPTTKITAKPIVARFVAAPIRVALTKTRPRPTGKALRSPTVVRVASVEQARRTIKTTFTSGRPRPRTYSALGSPGLIRSAPSQQAQTISTPFVRTRPRHTVTRLAPPTVVRQNPVKTTTSTSLVKTRPRPTTKVLGEPTVLRVASVEQLRRTILVTLTHTRPRHVVQALRLPTALRTFAGPRVTLVKSRPRPTTRRLSPPTRVLIQSVFQAQQTIRVKFVQTRPRPTTRRLAPPTKLAVQAVFQKQQTIRTALVQTRPQPTTTTLSPPTVVAVASVFQAQQTVRVGLTRIVPPPTVPLLRAPEVVATTTRAVATTNPSHPNEATTSATEQTEASLSSGRTDTIARVSESEATEATVSESEVTEAETEAT